MIAMSLDRLDEILPNEPAPPMISQFGTEYVRREYFEDGSKIFFSPLDFVLNGPDEGEIISRVKGDVTFKVRMGKKHYTNNSPIPFMCEVFISQEYKNSLHNEFIDESLWVVLEINEITIEKFSFHAMDSIHVEDNIMNNGYDGPFLSLQPQWLIGRQTPLNDISIIFSVVTGISKHYSIIMDRS